MQPTPPALLLNRSDIAAVLTLDDCVSIVEAAFAAHARGQSLAPGLLHTEVEGGEFHLKAGGLRGTAGARSYFAAKINGGFFQNRTQHELPNIQGLIVLFDSTGTALQDVATVAAAYERADAGGRGTRFAFSS